VAYFDGSFSCISVPRKLLLVTTFLPNCFSIFTRVAPAIFPPFFAAVSLAWKPCALVLRASSAVVVSPSMVSANSNGVMWSLKLWFFRESFCFLMVFSFDTESPS